jgi:hypothetical protein
MIAVVVEFSTPLPEASCSCKMIVPTMLVSRQTPKMARSHSCARSGPESGSRRYSSRSLGMWFSCTSPSRRRAARRVFRGATASNGGSGCSSSFGDSGELRRLTCAFPSEVFELRRPRVSGIERLRASRCCRGVAFPELPRPNWDGRNRWGKPITEFSLVHMASGSHAWMCVATIPTSCTARPVSRYMKPTSMVGGMYTEYALGDEICLKINQFPAGQWHTDHSSHADEVSGSLSSPKAHSMEGGS